MTKLRWTMARIAWVASWLIFPQLLGMYMLDHHVQLGWTIVAEIALSAIMLFGLTALLDEQAERVTARATKNGRPE